MEWITGDLIWFDPGVGNWLPGEVLECHRSANVLTVQAVINGKVSSALCKNCFLNNGHCIGPNLLFRFYMLEPHGSIN